MRAIDTAIASGEFTPGQENQSVVEEGDTAQNPVVEEGVATAIAFVQVLVNGGNLNVLDLQKLADDLQVPSEKLAQILKQSRGGITNGNNH